MGNAQTVTLRLQRECLTKDQFAAYTNLLRQLDPDLHPTPIAVQRLLSHPDVFVLFAYHAEMLVGTARIQVIPSCEGVSFRVDDVVVDEHYRHRAIGEALVARLHSIARAHRACRGNLTCNATRIHARTLYAKLGYTENSTCFSIDLATM